MDAKNTKRPKAKRVPLTKNNFQLVFSEFYTTNISAERFLRPDQAKKGFFKFGMESIKADPHNELKDGVIIVINMARKLEGYKAEEVVQAQDVESERSFIATLSADGLFRLNGPEGVECDVDQFTILMRMAISELNILVVERLRSLVSEMGYRNVRPDFGIPMEKLELNVVVNSLP